MDWIELKEEAKKMGAKIYKGYKGESIVVDNWLYLREDKYILTENDWGLIEQEIVEYDQMLAIMKALQ